MMSAPSCSVAQQMGEMEHEAEYWLCATTDLHPTRVAVAKCRSQANGGSEFAEDIFYGEQIGKGDPDGYADYLESEPWQIYRRAIFALQGGTCATCMNDATHCHHRTYTRCGIERDGDCVGLCADCHGALHAARKRTPRRK